mgnify:FL=1
MTDSMYVKFPNPLPGEYVTEACVEAAELMGPEYSHKSCSRREEDGGSQTGLLIKLGEKSVLSVSPFRLNAILEGVTINPLNGADNQVIQDYRDLLEGQANNVDFINRGRAYLQPNF